MERFKFQGGSSCTGFSTLKVSKDIMVIIVNHVNRLLLVLGKIIDNSCFSLLYNYSAANMFDLNLVNRCVLMKYMRLE